MTGLDVLKNIADKVSDKFEAMTGKKVFFCAGYDSEINNHLTILATGQQNIYPLIAVVIPELNTYDLNDDNYVECQFSRIVFATNTNANLTLEERMYANFTPILTPVCELFLKELKSNRNVKADNTKVTTTNIPFYSENNNKSNTYNNMLDGIVIRNFKFTILTKKCDGK